MPEKPLTPDARIALLVLRSSKVEISNKELKDQYGFAIGKERIELVDAGYITAYRKGNGPFTHTLTDKGWRRSREEMSMPPAKSGRAYRILYGQLGDWDAGMMAQKLDLADFYTVDESSLTSEEEPTVGARIIDAYPQLVAVPQGWVGLAVLRDHLIDISRDELDRTLLALYRENRIVLIPEANQKTLAQRDRDAAIYVGGDYQHLYSLDR